MKILFYILIIFISNSSYSQGKKTPAKRAKPFKAGFETVVTNHTGDGPAVSTSNTTPVIPARQTVTEQRLNGETKAKPAGSAAEDKGGVSSRSPFVGGIYPKTNADKTFDTSGANVNNTMNIVFTNTTGNSTDTIGNINTLNQGPVTTTSGTVDRSGQAQFGQTNWGESRRVVGESQWTVPPPVTTAFNKEFPLVTNATWARNNLDSTIYSARYRSGNYWITANYNPIGERLETITEIPYAEAPLPIRNLYSTRFNGIEIVTINRIQVMGKRDMYELKTRNGRTIYLNNEGAEVNY